MSPPDLPPTSFYRPLRELLAAVRGGGVLRPTMPEDIKSGRRAAGHPPGGRESWHGSADSRRPRASDRCTTRAGSQRNAGPGSRPSSPASEASSTEAISIVEAPSPEKAAAPMSPSEPIVLSTTEDKATGEGYFHTFCSAGPG